MSDSLYTPGTSNEELSRRVLALEAALEEIKRMLAQSISLSTQNSEMPSAQNAALIAQAASVPQDLQMAESVLMPTGLRHTVRALKVVPSERARYRPGHTIAPPAPPVPPAPPAPSVVAIPSTPPPAVTSAYVAQPAPREWRPEPPPVSVPFYPQAQPFQQTAVPNYSQPQPAQTFQPAQAYQPVVARAPKPAIPFSTRVLHAAETWMPKIGIVIFLFGIVFLFKYSMDQGWVNEQVRVGSGLLFGTVLLGAGLRINKKRRRFAAVLLGGGIATYYITGYAAYNLFPSLQIPVAAVFSFIAVVTAAAFLLSLRTNEVVLSIIGVAGGLLTPLALNHPEIELSAIVLYTCLVAAGASLIYLARGWRALLWSAIPCAWGVLIYCYTAYVFLNYNFKSDFLQLDRQLLQGGAIFLSLAFWALPVLREVLAGTNPGRWPTPPTPLTDLLGISFFMKYQVPILTLTLPGGAAFYSVTVWSGEISGETWGAVGLGLALLFAGLYFAIRRYPLPDGVLAYAHAVVAVGFLTLGIAGILHDDILLLALALEGAGLHLIARKSGDRGMAISGNVIFAIVGWWLNVRLLSPASVATPVWNTTALTDLAVIAVALAVSFVNRERTSALILRNGAHLAVMVWLWRELHALDLRSLGFTQPGVGVDSYGYVILAWAAYFALVAYVSRRIGDRVTLALAAVPYALIAAILAWRVVIGQVGDRVILNPKTLVDVAVLGFTYAALYMAAETTPFVAKTRVAIRTVIESSIVVLLWRELSWLPHGANYVLLAWAAYATLLHAVALLGRKDTPAWTAHGLSLLTGSGLLGLIVLDLILVNEDRTPVFSLEGLTTLGVVLLGGVSYLLVRRRGYSTEINFAYALWLHFAFLGWVWQEIGLIPGGSGNAYVSIVWGVYAVGLVVAGLRLGRNIRLLTCGIITLFALAAKLFLIDLQYVDAIWRILLFLGFGGFFLIFSYLLQGKLGRTKDDSRGAPSDADSAQRPL